MRLARGAAGLCFYFGSLARVKSQNTQNTGRCLRAVRSLRVPFKTSGEPGHTPGYRYCVCDRSGVRNLSQIDASIWTREIHTSATKMGRSLSVHLALVVSGAGWIAPVRIYAAAEASARARALCTYPLVCSGNEPTRDASPDVIHIDPLGEEARWFPPGASEEVIKLRFKELARQCHPDLTSGPESVERFKRLSNEYSRRLKDCKTQRAREDLKTAWLWIGGLAAAIAVAFSNESWTILLALAVGAGTYSGVLEQGDDALLGLKGRIRGQLSVAVTLAQEAFVKRTAANPLLLESAAAVQQRLWEASKRAASLANRAERLEHAAASALNAQRMQSMGTAHVPVDLSTFTRTPDETTWALAEAEHRYQQALVRFTEARADAEAAHIEWTRIQAYGGAEQGFSR